MRPEDIHSHLTERPFEPFRIITSSGATYDIRHPETVLVGLGSITIGIPAAPESPFYDRTTRVSLLHVERIEPLAVPTPGNGQE